MSEVVTRPRAKVKAKVERPRLYKVILINDDYTPREFVVTVLKAVFRMSESQATAVMITAHRRGACVVAVFARDIAESKAKEANDPRLRGGEPRPSRGPSPHLLDEPEEVPPSPRSGGNQG
jgi:ATP-dependent Clp protease adaptor protein ClpS